MHAPLHTDIDTDTQALWNYNQNLLQQALMMLDLLRKIPTESLPFPRAIGPHLRHIIEHYEALLTPLAQQADSTHNTPTIVIEYDARQRDKSVEASIDAATSRLHNLLDRIEHLKLEAVTKQSLETAVQVRLTAGLTGEQSFLVDSTLGRELMFVASHTFHHYALLVHYCREVGVELGHDFGKAPSTIAFEKASS